MLQRVAIISLALAFLCLAQTASGRLAATAKLWAYVKYMNSRVTARDVDWDAAFAEATPRVEQAATDRDFEAAIAQMLFALKDPMTRVAHSNESIGDRTRMMSTLTRENGVTVVRLESGDIDRATEMRDSLPKRLAGAGPVVFDLRGSLAIQNAGEGAIVSEDRISDAQIDLTRSVTVLGTLQAMVRYGELWYPDGTTGLSANVVLNKTGVEALEAAKGFARSGNWPPPMARPKLDLPSARFQEKSYADPPYPAREYRMMPAARNWGVFHYFHPYLNLAGEDWDAVLAKFLPKMTQTANAREYHLAVAEMVSHIHDSHAVCEARN
jgi:hypothetical protein